MIAAKPQNNKGKMPQLQLHLSPDRLPETVNGCVLVIGNFDGVHLGHRFLISEARKKAQADNRSLAVMTFEPHPREFFQKDGKPFRLTLLPLKQRLMAELGVDHLIAVTFDAAFARITGEGFIQDILVKKVAPGHIFVGADFAFGHQRSGTVNTLRQAAEKGGFSLTALEPQKNTENKVYSSTLIREHLACAEFDAAAELLGWRWSFTDTVIHGDKRGRLLGYPTANQQFARYTPLPYGVYAVETRLEDEEIWRAGIANFGIRPMFKTQTPLFETHIFDFQEEIYGKQLEVRPCHHLRSEKSFSDVSALKAQITQDCLVARSVLKSSCKHRSIMGSP